MELGVSPLSAYPPAGIGTRGRGEGRQNLLLRWKRYSESASSSGVDVSKSR